MRVIQVTGYGSPYPGAFVPMLSATLRVTRECGWDALAVLPARAQTRDWLPALEAEHSGDIVLAPEAGRRELGQWLTSLVDAGRGPTLLHSHFTIFDLAVARLACRRRDVRALWHFQTVLSESTSARLRNRVRFTVAGRCVERMLCVAPHLVEGIEARGAPPGKVEYFPNAIDTNRFRGRASDEQRADARAGLGLDPAATVLLHVGRDWLLKGGDLFLDAIRLLDRPGLVGLMLRGGDDARREVERRGLQDRVHVIEGTPEMQRVYAASDVMLATSRGEGMPFALLEALASGLAVVATDIPGHALAGTPSGLYIAALTPASLAEATTEVLDRVPERSRSDSACSHAWVRGTYGLDVWSERLLTVYREVTRPWLAEMSDAEAS
jgi:glycosyltransferase involved in cell wall biosynthesis